jgi:hypothetical protein
MSQTTTRYASYKGKTYRCLYTGQTKFGRKAKLSFLDGSKEFWVDLSLVTVDVPAPSSSRGSRSGNVCAECGKGGSLVSDLEDGLMKHRRCCDIEPD